MKLDCLKWRRRVALLELHTIWKKCIKNMHTLEAVFGFPKPRGRIAGGFCEGRASVASNCVLCRAPCILGLTNLAAESGFKVAIWRPRQTFWAPYQGEDILVDPVALGICTSKKGDNVRRDWRPNT
jgi:hypothetical protein